MDALSKAYAVQGGHLITGQQQNSGRKTAELVINSLLRETVVN